MIKIVKIAKDRGYGDGLFQVMRIDHSEYVLKPVAGGEQFVLYIAHTYEDFETKRKGSEMTRDRAAAIGRKPNR